MRSERAVAAAALLLGLLLLSGISTIDAGTAYDRIGPRSFPYLVAGGLIFLGVVLGASTFRDRLLRERVDPPSLRHAPVISILITLGLYVALLELAGFVVASSIQFFLIARAFQSPRLRRDLTVAVVFSTVVFIVFSHGLGLALPSGILTGVW
jgi:putative tricarboxylic transport membrane protein